MRCGALWKRVGGRQRAVGRKDVSALPSACCPLPTDLPQFPDCACPAHTFGHILPLAITMVSLFRHGDARHVARPRGLE